MRGIFAEWSKNCGTRTAMSDIPRYHGDIVRYRCQCSECSVAPESTAETPRMIDIARQAGVSRMAVSAVLMGTGEGRVRVAAETAERIRRIASELGYRPNLAARQLSGQRSDVIALVAHDSRNFLTQRALSRLHEVAETAGLRVMMVQGHRGLEPIRQLVRDLRSGWIGGLVYLAHENEAQWSDVGELLRHQPHTVCAVGDLQLPGVASVISDVASGAQAAMMHLADHGRSRPVFVTEERTTRSMQCRITALLEAARGRMTFDEPQIIVETKDWNVASPEDYPRFDALVRRLLLELRADSILCDTDFTAVGILRALRRFGVRVPLDVAVIGWGDLQFAALYDPPVTTVSYELTTVLSRVLAQLNGKVGSASSTETVAMRLIPRESTHLC